MTYNIHPLFVHFPIALLFVYSIIKILPLQKWLPNVAWKHIERVLLLVGVLGAFAALSTGEIAEHLTRPNHDLVETHQRAGSGATGAQLRDQVGQPQVHGKVPARFRGKPLRKLRRLGGRES